MAGRIEDYAIVGGMRSAALISRDGSADWMCAPRFDSPACFAALLGDERHGHWLIAPTASRVPGAQRGEAARRYQGDTLILETEWRTLGGAVRVIDLMPLGYGDGPVLVRIVEGVTGAVEMECVLRLRFGYGQVVPWIAQNRWRRRRGRRPRLGLAADAGQAHRTGDGPLRELRSQGRRAGAVRAELGALPPHRTAGG